MAINKDFIIPDAGLQVNGAAVISSTLGVNGAVTVANTIAVGNTTITGNVNVSVAANVGGALRAGGLITGAAGADITGTANASVAINVGANVNLSLTSINIGNSTVNTALTQTTIATGNTTVNTTITQSSLNTGNTTVYTNIGQATALFGNSTVNTAITSASIRTGNNSVFTSVNATALTTNGTLTVTGNTTLNGANLVISGYTTISNGVTITGDLIVSGTTTYVNTATLNIADNIITLNADLGAAVAPSENAGVEVNRGNAANVQLRWNETSDKWQITTDGTNYGDIHSKLTDVALGTDTSGNYVASLTSANGVAGSGTGEGSTPALYAVGANGISVTSAGINVLAGNGLISDSTNLRVVAGDGIVANTLGVNARAANGISVDTSGINVVAGTELTSNTTGVHHNDITRTNTTNGNTSPNYAGTFTTVDSITTNARGHVTAVNTKTVTMPSSNNTTYDLAAVANSAANEGRVRLTDSSNANDDVLFVGQDEITITSNSTAVYIDHNDITRTNTTTGNTSPNYAGTFTAVDSITTNARGHVTAVNTKTVTMPSSNNTTYTTSTVANTTTNQGLTRLTSSGNANTDTAIIGLDEITISSNSTAVYVDHNDVTRSDGSSSASPASGGTFTAIDSVTTNARGHVTAVNLKTVTLPVDPNTTYTTSTVANTTTNQGITRLTSSSNANTDTFVLGLDEITISSNTLGVYVDHSDVSRTNTTNGNTSPNYAGTFTAVDSITTNARGHVTAVNTKTVTMPSSNNTTYDLATAANTVANEGLVNLTGSDATTDSAKIIGLDEIVISSNTTAVYVDHNDVARSNTTSSASPASGGTFTAVDSVTTNARGHVTGLNLKTVTLPVDPNTTYDLAPVANTVANAGRIRLTDSANANDDVIVIGQDEITVSSNSTAIYIDHNDITRSDGTSSASPASGGTFTAVDSVTTNARGHVTAINVKTVTLPVDPNTTYTSAAVANSAANEGRARLTSSGNANTDVLFIGQDELTVTSNSTAIYIDHNDVARTNNTSTASPASGGTFTAIDSITTNARGHLTAINTKTVTLPVDPNTTYDLLAVANTTTSNAILRLADSSNSNDNIFFVGSNEVVTSSNATHIIIDHGDVARSNNTSSASPASGGTFTAIDSITTNARGHVTAINTKTVTLPVDPNTTYTGANGVALSGTTFYANVGATLVANASGIHLPSVATAGSSTGGISAITIDAQGRVTSVTGSAGYLTAVPNASTQVSSLGVGTAASGTSGEIRATNNITAYYSSDKRLKENIAPIEDAVEKVSAIGGKTFDWTDEYISQHGGEDGYFVRKSDFGVIAQDVEQVFPAAVRQREDGTLAVDYEKLVALAFQAIKELKAEIEDLKKKT